MAAKPKADAPKDDEEEEAAEGAEAQTGSPKKGLVGRILGAPMAVLRLRIRAFATDRDTYSCPCR